MPGKQGSLLVEFPSQKNAIPPVLKYEYVYRSGGGKKITKVVFGRGEG